MPLGHSEVGRAAPLREPGLVLGWGILCRVILKCGSEVGAAALATRMSGGKGGTAGGSDPLPLAQPGLRLRLSPGRAGEEVDGVRVCAAPPAWVFCLAGLLALPTRSGEEGGGDFDT